MLAAQLCLTLCNLTDCSLPGSSVHGIYWARILAWVATPFSKGASRPRNWTQVSYTAGRFFTVWATREAPSWYRCLKITDKNNRNYIWTREAKQSCKTILQISSFPWGYDLVYTSTLECIRKSKTFHCNSRNTDSAYIRGGHIITHHPNPGHYLVL